MMLINFSERSDFESYTPKTELVILTLLVSISLVTRSLLWSRSDTVSLKLSLMHGPLMDILFDVSALVSPVVLPIKLLRTALPNLFNEKRSEKLWLREWLLVPSLMILLASSIMLTLVLSVKTFKKLANPSFLCKMSMYEKSRLFEHLPSIWMPLRKNIPEKLSLVRPRKNDDKLVIFNRFNLVFYKFIHHNTPWVMHSCSITHKSSFLRFKVSDHLEQVEPARGDCDR